MAGAGYKNFTAGDVLAADDVDTYLQEQSPQPVGPVGGKNFPGGNGKDELIGQLEAITTPTPIGELPPR